MDNTNETVEKQETRKILMAVAFDADTNMYYVDLAKGSNAAETAFAMSVVIKCLIKDGIIDRADVITDLVNKYLNDPQFSEVTDEEVDEEANESGSKADIR